MPKENAKGHAALLTLIKAAAEIGKDLISFAHDLRQKANTSDEDLRQKASSFDMESTNKALAFELKQKYIYERLMCIDDAPTTDEKKRLEKLVGL